MYPSSLSLSKLGKSEKEILAVITTQKLIYSEACQFVKSRTPFVRVFILKFIKTTLKICKAHKNPNQVSLITIWYFCCIIIQENNLFFVQLLQASKYTSNLNFNTIIRAFYNRILTRSKSVQLCVFLGLLSKAILTGARAIFYLTNKLFFIYSNKFKKRRCSSNTGRERKVMCTEREKQNFFSSI